MSVALCKLLPLSFLYFLMGRMESMQLERNYRGYSIEGKAQSVYGGCGAWYAVASVTLLTSQQTLIQVYRYEDHQSTDSDAGLAAWFGLFLAEIAVDHFIPSTDYYLTPMHAAWAIDLVQRGAAEFMDREVRSANFTRRWITWGEP